MRPMCLIVAVIRLKNVASTSILQAKLVHCLPWASTAEDPWPARGSWCSCASSWPRGLNRWLFYTQEVEKSKESSL